VEKVRIEIEVEDQPGSKVIEVEQGSPELLLKEVLALAALENAHVFERDKDEPVGREIENRKALSVIVHRCHKVQVKVHYEHNTKEHDFAPSATIFRVLLWAISKKAFNLDDTAKAKANLMLPKTENPLPKDSVIGSFVKHGECHLTLELTLRDFTNG
jgi:hypothetical protein